MFNHSSIAELSRLVHERLVSKTESVAHPSTLPEGTQHTCDASRPMKTPLRAAPPVHHRSAKTVQDGKSTPDGESRSIVHYVPLKETQLLQRGRSSRTIHQYADDVSVETEHDIYERVLGRLYDVVPARTHTPTAELQIGVTVGSTTRKAKTMLKITLSIVSSESSFAIHVYDLEQLSQVLHDALQSRKEQTALLRVEFAIDTIVTLHEASRILLALATSLSKLRIAVIINVASDSSSPLNGFARGFFKSVAAEKPKTFSIPHDVVLRPVEAERVAQRFQETMQLTGAWLITGGTAGIGLEMAAHLVRRYSVPCVVLVSRRPPSEAIRQRLTELHTDVHVLEADISDSGQTRQVFDRILKLPYALEGVIHSAGCARDAILELQTEQNFAEVTAAKCQGLLNIDAALSELDLRPEYLIVNSSISAVIGNVGQTPYSASNAFVDAFVRRRRRTGLSGSSINWGNWLEVGMAANAGLREKLQSFGFSGLCVPDALRCVDYVIHARPEQVFVAEIDWDTLWKHRPDLKRILQRGSELVATSQPAKRRENDNDQTDSVDEQGLHKGKTSVCLTTTY